MRNLSPARRTAQLRPSPFELDPPLSRAERRRVALAALQIEEQRYKLRLAQISIERRALLADTPSSLWPAQ